MIFYNERTKRFNLFSGFLAFDAESNAHETPSPNPDPNVLSFYTLSKNLFWQNVLPEMQWSCPWLHAFV